MRWQWPLGLLRGPLSAITSYGEPRALPCRRAGVVVGRRWGTEDASLSLVQRRSRITAPWHADSAGEPCQMRISNHVSGRSATCSRMCGGRAEDAALRRTNARDGQSTHRNARRVEMAVSCVCGTGGQSGSAPSGGPLLAAKGRADLHKSWASKLSTWHD